MKLKSIRFARFPVPFKVAFRHASANRRHAENIIVVAESERGLRGYGEGCPRDYVTGETLDSARRFIEQHRGSICARISSVPDLEGWIAEQTSVIDRNPAAFCALELALLDLLGKETGQALEALLGLPRLTGEFHYSAVLGDSPAVLFGLQLFRYWAMGMRDFKVKISGDPARDGKKIRLLARLGDPPPRVRLDANNLWTDSQSCSAFIRALSYPFFALEEPLQAGDLGAFREVARALDTKIVLDESMLRSAHLPALRDDPELWILNCRVSKMGGLLRTLALGKQARQAGIGLIVGAHVGETSILTRAALTVAHGFRDGLLAQEGAFGTYLLREDLCEPSLRFGKGGRLKPADGLDCDAPGLGLVVNEAAIQ